MDDATRTRDDHSRAVHRALTLVQALAEATVLALSGSGDKNVQRLCAANTQMGRALTRVIHMQMRWSELTPELQRKTAPDFLREIGGVFDDFHDRSAG